MNTAAASDGGDVKHRAEFKLNQSHDFKAHGSIQTKPNDIGSAPDSRRVS
jgi:hypothetical protein